MRTKKSKRYVLLKAGGELSRDDVRTLGRYLEQRAGKVVLIQPEANRATLIVKTDVAGAAAIVESSADLVVSDKRVATVLVSGSIGKLKRRAEESATREIAEVPQ